MAELTYQRICEILDSRAAQKQQLAAAQRIRPVNSRSGLPVIDRSQNRAIVDAFEEVRRGYEPDRVLVDTTLHRAFLAACRRRGVDAPDQALSKKLQGFRKNSAFYGVRFKPSTRASGLDFEPFLYAAELAFVQMSQRGRVSIDDIVTEPNVGNEFVKLCREIKPQGRAVDFKWAALCLRKMRAFNPAKKQKLLDLKAEAVEENLRLVGTLDRISLTDVPAEKGLFTLSEKRGTKKCLYVGATLRSLRDALEPFRAAKPLAVVAGPSWKPVLADISLRVAPVKKLLLGIGARDLALRLIEERRPRFNMPVKLAWWRRKWEEETLA